MIHSGGRDAKWKEREEPQLCLTIWGYNKVFQTSDPKHPQERGSIWISLVKIPEVRNLFFLDFQVPYPQHLEQFVAQSEHQTQIKICHMENRNKKKTASNSRSKRMSSLLYNPAMGASPSSLER